MSNRRHGPRQQRQALHHPRASPFPRCRVAPLLLLLALALTRLSLLCSQAEHSGGLGEHSASRGARAKNTVLAKLPFDHCALTLKPFETPVCTADGTVYELVAIIPFIRQHGTDPMTGKKLAPGDLVRLNYARNNDGVRPSLSLSLSLSFASS